MRGMRAFEAVGSCFAKKNESIFYSTRVETVPKKTNISARVTASPQQRGWES